VVHFADKNTHFNLAEFTIGRKRKRKAIDTFKLTIFFIQPNLRKACFGKLENGKKDYVISQLWMLLESHYGKEFEDFGGFVGWFVAVV
jgi:hypothetical protein